MRDSIFSELKDKIDKGENIVLILGDLGVYQAENIRKIIITE